MTNPETPRHVESPRHVEIKDEDDRIVAEAEVSTALGPEGTVRTSMHAKNEHARRGDRTHLVDTVMDLPEVRASERVEAAVPYGDGESLERLRQRTEDARTRVAGATTLLDANVPSASARPAAEVPDPRPAAAPRPGQEPADGQPPADA
jgi:hypothetical protein